MPTIAGREVMLACRSSRGTWTTREFQSTCGTGGSRGLTTSSWSLNGDWLGRVHPRQGAIADPLTSRRIADEHSLRPGHSAEAHCPAHSTTFRQLTVGLCLIIYTRARAGDTNGASIAGWQRDNLHEHRTPPTSPASAWRLNSSASRSGQRN